MLLLLRWYLLLQSFVFTYSYPRSQGNLEIRQYGIIYERQHIETPETDPINSSDSAPKTATTKSNDSATVPIYASWRSSPEPSVDLASSSSCLQLFELPPTVSFLLCFMSTLSSEVVKILI